MTDWESTFKSNLLDGEELISFVPELEHWFAFVPDVNPDNDGSTVYEMALGLTNLRLMARYANQNVWKWFYTSMIYSLTERHINKNKPNWPYQATMIFPGGLGLIIQTKTVDKTQQDKLSSLLVHAYMKFGVRGADTGEIAAIIANEERKRRQSDDSERK